MINPSLTSTAEKSSTWVWVVLLATLALTAWTAINSQPDEINDGIELAKPEAKATASAELRNRSDAKLLTNESLESTPSAPASGLIPWQQLKRENTTGNPIDLFSVHSWVIVPPAPKVKPAPPSTPVAPPAPFTYMGKLEEGPNGNLMFFMANNQVYSVAIGEKIDAFWRLDGEDDTSVNLTYLPLGLSQTLPKHQMQAPVADPMATTEMNQ